MHISASIEGLLRIKSTKSLGTLLNMDGHAARIELNGRLAKGEKLIPSEGCEGFDPIKGCPGHEIK